MPSKRVTLKDIARETGFSVNTVSHAINDRDDISRATKDIVLSAVERLGYIPNSTAVSMRSGRSGTIALIMPDIRNMYFPIMIKLLENELSRRNCNILIMETNEQAEDEYRCVVSAISKNVDGLIICPCQQDTKALELLRSQSIPFVLMGRYFATEKYTSVVMDDVQCGYIATKYLLDMGHKDILFLASEHKISSIQERQMGYESALKEAGVPINQQLIRKIGENDSYSRIVGDIVSDKLHCTAIFAFSDMLALGIMYFLKKAGLRIPEDISVIGVDNLESNYILPLELTTIDAPKEEQVQRMIEAMFSTDRSREDAKGRYLITPQLVVRNTVAPPNVKQN